MRLPRFAFAVCCLLTVVAVVAGAALHLASSAARAATSGSVLLPNGRLATPAGSRYDTHRMQGDAAYDLGDFPLGLALSPDGRLAVASLNGYGMGQPHGFNSFCEQNQSKPGVACPGVPQHDKVNTGTTAPDEGLDVVDLRTGRVRQVVAVPTSNRMTGHTTCNQGFNCFGMGVTFSPDGRHVYATGGGADCIYDFAVVNGRLTLAHVVPIPSPSSRVPGYPVIGTAAGYPRGVAETPDGKTLLVVDEFDSTIEAFDVAGGKAPVLEAQALLPAAVPGPVPVAYLYAVAVSPDGAHAYVTAEGTGILYTVDVAGLLATAPVAGRIPVLPATAVVSTPLVGVNHPTGLAVSPHGDQVLVAGTDSDNVARVALDAGLPVEPVTTTPVGVAPAGPGEFGAKPDAVAFDATGRRAYVALAGDDATAVLDAGPTPTVRGYLPTGWYPTDVKVGPKDGRVYTIAAKGLGSRYVAGIGGYTPARGRPLPSGASLPSSDYYDAENMPGLLTRVTAPTPARLAAYTATARADIAHAAQLDQRPPHSPIPARLGDPSPITHVVYIVRENRTFDQVFGDLRTHRKDVDADPYYQVLAPATPNAHKIASRYAIADHFYSDGEASVQGHWWTAAADVNDYVEKSWRQYYSPRGRPSDEAVLPITTPPGCSIFQALQAHQAMHPQFSFENYGELVGLVTPTTSVGEPEANLCQGVGPTGGAQGNSFSDPNYPSQAELTPDDRTRAAEFLKNSGLNLDGTSAGNGGYLRNFNYLILSEDHTSGLAGTNTPRSQVAQNDAALGQILSGLSKSAYWPSTAVFVVEDDSQDGVDHVDGHRNVLLVASPWTKHVSADGCLPGFVGHAHYDQTSVLRTMELILGVTPVSDFDAGATPLYDLFQDKNDPRQLTRDDLAPYDVAPNPPFIDEKVANLPHSSKNQALRAYSVTLDTRDLDIDEAGIEDVLWHSLRSGEPPASRGAATYDTGPVTLSTVTGHPFTGTRACTSHSPRHG